MSTSTTTHVLSKPSLSKWFANKTLKLSFNNRSKTKSNLSSSSLSSSSSSSSSPNSPISNPNSETLKSGKSKEDDELREVFRRFDENNDGKISALELRSYFGSIGEYMSHEQAKAVIDDFDADGDKLLDFQEFQKLMKRDDDKDRDRDDIKRAFEMFDLEQCCITPRSVQRMLCRLGDTRSFDECKAMVRVFDKDGNGVLDFNEFHQMMTA